MTNTDKIIVFVGDQEKELTGKEKTDFLSQKQIDLAAEAVLQTEKETKAQARTALLNRLGITEDEAKLLLN
jgi:hypothetical protein